MVCVTVKKALLTTRDAIKYGVRAEAKVIVGSADYFVESNGGRNIGEFERRPAEIDGYRDLHVARDYHLHVNQLVAPTVSPLHAYLEMYQSLEFGPNWGYCYRS